MGNPLARVKTKRGTYWLYAGRNKRGEYNIISVNAMTLECEDTEIPLAESHDEALSDIEASFGEYLCTLYDIDGIAI